jgi:nitrogen fixation/metabolism regulation signal transduction histidine kinase
MGWAPRTLKGQLTALFLILTLVPSVLLIAFGASRILSAVAKWETPGVELALDGSISMTQELWERTENDLRQRGQILAADPIMSFSKEYIEAEAGRRPLAATYNLDFVQVYTAEGTLVIEDTRDRQIAGIGAVRAIAEVAASSKNFLESVDPDLLADPDSLAYPDFLAYVGYAGAPGESEWIIVAGIYLDTGFYLRRKDLETGVRLYGGVPALISFQQRVIFLSLVVLLVALAAGSIFVARRLAERVSRPVHALGAGMERVARGDETVRVPPQGSAEMERLIETFNQMSTELSRSRKELARAERLSAWRDVAQRVAHEIKNALTPMTFSAHRIRKEASDLGQEQRTRLLASLDTVVEEVEGLKRLAASFSELARLPVPEFTTCDLRDVVNKTVAAFDAETGRIETQVPASAVMVEGDWTLLRQALANVIKNALEATEDGDRIRVVLERGDTHARILVEDEGPGWPEGGREQSMDPYVTTKAEGTGLGLSLVQRTMLQHGGAVELGDRAGGGARVTLRLPHRVSVRETEELES